MSSASFSQRAGTDADGRRLTNVQLENALLALGVSGDKVRRMERWEKFRAMSELCSPTAAIPDAANMLRFARDDQEEQLELDRERIESEYRTRKLEKKAAKAKAKAKAEADAYRDKYMNHVFLGAPSPNTYRRENGYSSIEDDYALDARRKELRDERTSHDHATRAYPEGTRRDVR